MVRHFLGKEEIVSSILTQSTNSRFVWLEHLEDHPKVISDFMARNMYATEAGLVLAKVVKTAVVVHGVSETDCSTRQNES